MLHAISNWIVALITQLGYPGLFSGMFLQATGFVPLPSEIMMLFGGYLADQRALALWLVIVAGALGDVAGALVAYAIGYFGGRPLLERFGRFVFVRPDDLARADKWFDRFGNRAVFICRLLPGIRAIGSLPAGIARMHLGHFIAYTGAGAAIWCTGFASLGFVLGEHWTALEPFVRRFSILLLALAAVAVGAWIWTHFRAQKLTAKA